MLRSDLERGNKYRSKETSQIVFTVIEEEADGLAQDGSSEDGEKWSDSEYILKVQPTGFPRQIGCGCQKKTDIKVTPKSFSLS